MNNLVLDTYCYCHTTLISDGEVWLIKGKQYKIIQEEEDYAITVCDELLDNLSFTKSSDRNLSGQKRRNAEKDFCYKQWLYKQEDIIEQRNIKINDICQT